MEPLNEQSQIAQEYGLLPADARQQLLLLLLFYYYYYCYYYYDKDDDDVDFLYSC